MRESLRSILRDLEVDDPREAQGLERMRRLLATSSNPFSREHYEPGHFTASAFVLSPDRGSVLLVFHSKLRRWLQPGGHIEPSDASPWAAARREVSEETGLVELDLMDPANVFGQTQPPPLFDLDVHEIPARTTEPAHLHHDLRFLFVARSLRVIAGDGVEASRWVPLAQMDGIESDASVMRAIRKIRRLKLQAGEA